MTLAPPHLHQTPPPNTLPKAHPSSPPTHLQDNNGAHHAVINRTVQELMGEQRESFRLDIERVTDPSTRHHTNVKDIINHLIFKAGTPVNGRLPLTAELIDTTYDPKQYTNVGLAGYGSFNITSPAQVAEYFRNAGWGSFHISVQQGVHYRVRLARGVAPEELKAKQVSTNTIFWGQLHMGPGMKHVPLKDIEAAFRSHLGRASLRLTKFERRTDKESKTLLDFIRFEFEPLPTMKVTHLSKAAQFSSGGDTSRVMISREACAELEVHRLCLKPVKATVKGLSPNDYCACDITSGGPSAAEKRARSIRAQERYAEDSNKRARASADPNFDPFA